MHSTTSNKNFFKKLLAIVLSFGPGIFAIGYTIGTGSVTSMIVAGSTFGMQLLWVLLLSCIFSGILIYTYGKYTLVTGETALFGFKNHLKAGKVIAILIVVGISFGQWNSLTGILGISANMIYEIIAIYYPSISNSEYQFVLVIAIVIIVTFYGLLMVGKYTFFEKVLVIFVTIMGVSFIASLFFVFPQPKEIISGLIPSIPDVKGGQMLTAAFVGTTMAAATFLSRPLFVLGKGWTIKDLKKQKNDSITAAILVFLISSSIMAVASGALYHEGKVVTKVLDMVNTLEPIAGRFALTIFVFGTLSAGLSSIFPCLMIAPLLLADYQEGKLDTDSKQFKIVTAIAALVALLVPILGKNPIQAQILTQVFNVFVLPLVIIGIIVLANNKKRMGNHRISVFINIGLVLALIFSLVISYNGIMAVMNYF
ncbi:MULTISPECIES: Nramp family divalent metal transporter [unclassified Saccharicrinis]|uniref:Nramp family divalent metal transporter n=1 Tax=unclassified Saccharicrinis TaxID=2646859 RepID=UPI003D34A72D